jgi:hypothetical protein
MTAIPVAPEVSGDLDIYGCTFIRSCSSMHSLYAVLTATQTEAISSEGRHANQILYFKVKCIDKVTQI